MKYSWDVAVAKLPTSREVYDRIRWDARLRPQSFVIGYDHHKSEPKELAFEAFSPNDVPWHRILYFKHDGRIVWDRRARIDDLASITTEATVARTTKTTEFVDRPVYRWDGAVWARSSEVAPTPAATSFRVLTWNILFDLFDGEKLDTEARVPRILERLEAADADVVALQEVTPPFLEKLLASRFVQRAYASSEGAEAKTVTPSGQLLLSKLPLVGLGERRFSRSKHAIIGRVLCGNEELSIAAIHLTSDREPGAEKTRAWQLAMVLDELAQATGPAIVVGDFNAGDEATIETRDFVDVWPHLRRTEPGITFDPGANRLAALTTLRHLARRLDRVLLRRATARTIDLFANDAECPSDHYGVLAEIATAPELSPVHETAIVLLPPKHVWAPIQALRAKHDRHFVRWMPHITLLFGFVPEARFDEVLPLLAGVVRSLEPFRIELGPLRAFEHAKSATIWAELVTTPPRAIHELQAALERAFPRCNEQSTKGSEGFTPHLTLGSVPADAVARCLAEWKLPRLAWDADEIVLLARGEETPFEAVRRLPLGTIVDEACAAAVGGRSRVYAFGAAALGIETEESDRDFVCVAEHGATTREAFFAALAGMFPGARVIAEAFVPVVRFVSHGRETEVAFAELPEGVVLGLPKADVIHRMDLVSQRSIGGVLDAEALLAALRAADALGRFRSLAQRVRAWARERAIDEGALGYPSRFTWTILAAKAAIDDADFFALFGAWDFREPIALTEDAQTYRARDRDRMIVPTLTAPARNSARSLTRSTLASVVRALRGHAEAPPTARITLGHHDEARHRAWIGKHFVPLLLALEDDPALELRPASADAHTTTIDVRGVSAEDLRARIQALAVVDTVVVVAL